ncbi:MAG TPA: DMT family transporter [Beijerinckiaceae bacterium]|nr:DMT family transporter [Beijerinckiaceae bacterium]
MPIVLCLVAIGLLTLMNGFIKALTGRYDPLEIAFLRYVVGGSWALLATAWIRPGWPERSILLPQIARGTLGMVSGTSFFFALRDLPLADTFTISFLAPLFVTILAMLFLKERPRALDIVALLLGFAGVLVIALGVGGSGAGRPLFGMSAAMLSAITYAISIVMLRSLAQSQPHIHMVLFQHWVSALWLLPAVLMVWKTPELADLPVLLLAPLLGVAGHLLMTHAYARMPAARLAPTEYSALIYAITLDSLWFSTSPANDMLLGAIAIILAAALAARR